MRAQRSSPGGAASLSGVAAPAPREYHGAWTFYFKSKGGYFIEVATQTGFGDAAPQ